MSVPSLQEENTPFFLGADQKERAPRGDVFYYRSLGKPEMEKRQGFKARGLPLVKLHKGWLQGGGDVGVLSGQGD